MIDGDAVFFSFAGPGREAVRTAKLPPTSCLDRAAAPQATAAPSRPGELHPGFALAYASLAAYNPGVAGPDDAGPTGRWCRPSNTPTTLTRQLVAISAVVPGTVGAVRRDELTCRLSLQPSLTSQTYTVRLIYRHDRYPHVTVTDPPLASHPDAVGLPPRLPG
ncbi:hypothetical protein GCM10027615_15570 [Plantactinospora veratri]